ncbi:uncharacterized protein LOC127881683 [Dreissena polymorpha]|uniref:Uncharacterized protein n=1 Tax=Dreissena polymorpha TaxID=45954 RepID=A0A9D4JPI2_DREPO|nr:uncharacterized protein LOC127881683 [Dreissena polymorpha]KAH3819785.1 hypothetical protein DPMN_121529 [Dreissena polymorpha]
MREKLKTYHSYRYENFQNQHDEFKKNLHTERNRQPVGYFFLHVYLSYSPCGKCAGQLINFAREFHGQLDVKINISFSTFYKHNKPSIWAGLLGLSNNAKGELRNENRICMPILNGEESCEKFFQDIEVKGTVTLSKWRYMATTDERQEREAEDNKIFRMLEGSKQYVGKVPPGYCYKFFNDFDTHTHTPCPYGYKHQCLKCDNIHDLPYMCDKFV